MRGLVLYFGLSVFAVLFSWFAHHHATHTSPPRAARTYNSTVYTPLTQNATRTHHASHALYFHAHHPSRTSRHIPQHHHTSPSQHATQHETYAATMHTNKTGQEQVPSLPPHVISHILSFLSSSHTGKRALARCFQVCKLWHSFTPPFFFKPHVSFTFVGISQPGKTTLLGHLLHKLGKVQESVAEQIKKDSEQYPLSNEYAMVLDRLKAERERGTTIDPKIKTVELADCDLTLIDTPGFAHVSYNSLAMGDVTVVVASHSPGQQGITLAELAQTATHCGCEIKILVLSCKTTEFQDTRQEITENVLKILEEGGCSTKNIKVIPVCGLKGENLTEKANYPWYNGPTLLEALLEENEPLRMYAKPLRISIIDSYNISGVGVVLFGKVHMGVLTPGMHLSFAPHTTTSVVSLEVGGKSVSRAVAGEFVAFHVDEKDWKVFKRGMVAGEASNDPPRVAKSFTANVRITSNVHILCGFTPLVVIGMSRVACKLTKIKEKKDITDKTGKTVILEPKNITTGEEALVEFLVQKPTYFSTPECDPVFSKFIVMDIKRCTMVGTVKEVIYGS